jgi:peptidylprolyl isomerase
MTKTKVTIAIIIIIIIVSYLSFRSGAGSKQREIINKIDSEVTLASTTESLIPENKKSLIINNKEKMTTSTLHTNKGDITIEFYNELTPNTVANFTKLAQSGFYDGVKFHRVIKDFMIQSGDPLSKDDNEMYRWGTGGPGYKFEDEITPENRNDSGTISMANAGPDTNGSQFFINVKDNNFLDTKHTVFGKVVKGMDVVNAIQNSPTGERDIPKEPIIIKNISF